MSDRLTETARELPALLQDAAHSPDPTAALRTVLRQVHDAVMRESVDRDAPPIAPLRQLAEALRTGIPDPVEDGLRPRVRIFVRLLRTDAVEAAWMLANDNASGVVQSTSAVSTWSGARHERAKLPLPTYVEDGAVYAWLPGFRDPRWAVPDEVYDIGAEVKIRGTLDRATFGDDELHLVGSAWLNRLAARQDDNVTVMAIGEAERIPFAATRTRTCEHVTGGGPGMTELAWTGWTATIGLSALATRPADWALRIRVVQQGVRRVQPFGRARGPLAEPELVATPYEGRSYRARLHDDEGGRLVLQVRPIETPARLLPVPARAVLRRFRGDAVTPSDW